MKFWGSKRAEAPVEPPVLSIIVPAYKVEKFLDECLDSLRQQDLRAVEIIVVDDGSPDKVSHITQRHVKADPRVRLVKRPNGGLSAARTTGIEHARGRYLTFVDSDDVVTTRGLAAAVESLEKSGSDWAMLPYRQFSKAGPHELPPWIAALYRDGTRTIKPAESLDALVQATAWSKVYRRDFWDRIGLVFRVGVLYEDQEVSAAAFRAAEAIDLVDSECYLWRVRGGSITREATAHSMSQFFAAVSLALEQLAPIPGAVAERSRQLLANDVPRYVRALAKVNDEGYAHELFAGIRLLWPNVEREPWLAETPAEAKIIETLVANDCADDVRTFIDANGFELAQHAFESTPDGPALRFPLFDDQTLDRAVFVLSERQTPADARALRVVLNEQGVDLEFMAYLRHLDTGTPDARAWLCADGERHQELVLTQVDGLFGHRMRTTRASNERSVWRTRFDWPDTVSAQTTHELTVEIEVSHLGRTATTRLVLIDPVGSAAWPQKEAGWVWSGAEPACWQREAADVAMPAQPELSVPDDPEAPESVPSVLDLPVDLDDGWWGLNEQGDIAWHASPAATREQETFWWQRDHSGE